MSSQHTIHHSLRHLHCLGNVQYRNPCCFHPNDLPSLADGTFPHDKSNWPATRSWLLGWPKLCWFQLYCSKTLWSISLIYVRHVTWYIHIILTIFQEVTQCLTLWKISLETFCKNFFPGVYIWSRYDAWGPVHQSQLNLSSRLSWVYSCYSCIIQFSYCFAGMWFWTFMQINAHCFGIISNRHTSRTWVLYAKNQFIGSLGMWEWF